MNKDFQTTKLGYSNPDQEEFIQQLITELNRYMALQGEIHGQKNRPMSPAELRSLAVNHIEVTIQSALDDNRSRHLLASGTVIARKILVDAEIEISSLDSEINSRRHRIDKLDIQKNQNTHEVQRVLARKYSYYAVGVISAAEGFFINEALRHGNVPKIPALFMSAGIAAAIAGCTHIVAGWITKAKTRLGKILRYSAVLIPAFIGFAALGSLRADAYNNIISLHVGSSQVFQGANQVSWWNLTIPSFILFMAVLLISIKYHKTEEELKREQLYNAICKEIDALKLEIEALRKKQQKIRNNADMQAQLALLRFDYAAMNENRFETYARHALELYKDKNILFRSDGTPEFYSYPPVFNFKFYFKTFKNNSYETNNVHTNGSYVH